MNAQITVIDPDGTERLLPTCPNLSEMQAIVGGHIELVTVLDRVEGGQPIYTRMIVNEDGRALGLPDNPKATEIYQRNARWQYPDADNPFEAMTAVYRERTTGTVINLGTPEDLVDPRIVGPAILFEGFAGLDEVDHFLEGDD